ncbi:MAG: hypothetical protein GX244_02525 [Firmicutes bacterium]|nr:hypothetical protein [Bacillota bacterium]
MKTGVAKIGLAPSFAQKILDLFGRTTTYPANYHPVQRLAAGIRAGRVVFRPML